MQSAMMVKAEIEASQKLASVIPFQTGRPDRLRQSFTLDQQNFLPTTRYSMFEQTRPKSVIEDKDELKSIFKNDWSFGLVPPVETKRPKSADMSHWNASLWTNLDQPWSNRSSVLANEELASPPVILSVYNDTSFNSVPTLPPQRYGQFLSPAEENGYFSDHSDQSNGSKNRKKKENGVDMQLLQGKLDYYFIITIIFTYR